jgi:hypothetical protein
LTKLDLCQSVAGRRQYLGVIVVRKLAFRVVVVRPEFSLDGEEFSAFNSRLAVV